MMIKFNKIYGMPACAGMTPVLIGKQTLKNNRHARAGGHPILLFHFCLLALLCSCATEPPVYKPVEISVPVTTPCKPPDVQPPDSPLNHLVPQASLFDKVKAVLSELEQRKAYEAELTAGIKACQ